ncbi:hypothetical protein ACFQ5N_04320 [Lutibacter holmesii]|uniref:Lipoprotein n=1 Tax=Lutibacter holmesii TaxID=1137985 RepID=A0ABW3WMY6_9FLAO
MKVTFFFKCFILVFAVLLFQGCKVYHTQKVTLEEAIAAKQKVKVLMWDKKFTFCKLIYIDNQLYGTHKITSTTAKKLDNLMVGCSLDGKTAKFKLNELEIQEIYLCKK